MLLGGIPHVVAIIDRKIPVETVNAYKKTGAGLLEIRADLFTITFKQILEYIRMLRANVDLPIIGTLRETDGNCDKRLALFEQLVPEVDAVDIEVDAAINQDVISLARKMKKTVIISEHNYTSTPDIKGLEMIVAAAKKLNADITKIAVMAQNRSDVARLMSFTYACKENLVTIALGPHGAITRIVAPFFGSLFTYAYVSDSVAPGQLSLESLVEALKEFYPEF